MPGSIEVWFATSSGHKFREAKLILGEFAISPGRLGSKGTEVQSDDVSEIARDAALDSYRRYGRRLFAEDTGLFVDALGGFPGAYASHAFQTIGLAGVLRLLSGKGDRTAEFRSAVAYADGSGMPKVFLGRLRGSISRSPRGSEGFGFDPIFIPEGGTRTLAELSLAEKCSLSHRAAALRGLGAWLRRRQTG